MSKHIALFRGINVGGRHSLPMKRLVAVLEELGAREVRTYIQSGNAVFSHRMKDGVKLARRIGEAVEEECGFEVQVLVLGADDLADAMSGNPFPEAEDEPKSLHLFFLQGDADADAGEKLAALAAPTERFQIDGRVFYLHAPDGVGRSKLVAKLEKCLGVSGTGRNWRTVNEISKLLAEPDA